MTLNGTPYCSTHTWKDISGEKYESHNDSGMLKYTHDWFKTALRHAESLWLSAEVQEARNYTQEARDDVRSRFPNRPREEAIGSWIPYSDGGAAKGSIPTPTPDLDDCQPLLGIKQAYARSDETDDSQYSDEYGDRSVEGETVSSSDAPTTIAGRSRVVSEDEGIKHDSADSIAANTGAVSSWAESEVQDKDNPKDGGDTRGRGTFTMWAATPEAHIETVHFLGRQCLQIVLRLVWQEYPGNERTQAFRRFAKLPIKED